MSRKYQQKENIENSFDPIFLTSVFFLLFLGLCIVYTSSSVNSERLFDHSFHYFNRQLRGVILGIFLFFFFAQLSYLKLKKFARLFLVLSIISLILVFFPIIGKSVGNEYNRNFHRWLDFGFFQVQPSEFAKIAVILYISLFITKIKSKQKVSFAFAFFSISLVIILILLQPSFGTTVAILSVITAYIYLFGFSLKNLFFAALTSVPFFFILIYQVGYRKKRIDVWLDPYKYRYEEGNQLVLSFRSFLEGGFWGKKITSGISHKYLAYNHTDFIFSTFVEDFGFLGSLLLISLILLFFFRSYQMLSKVREPFGFYLGSGILIMIAIQYIINFYVVVGLFPITGIGLPLISYGSSSLVSIMISLGIFTNITKKENWES